MTENTAPGQRRALIIDVDSTVGNQISNALTEMCFAPSVCCSDTKQARTLIQNEHFDFIFIDVHLPGYAAMTFLQILAQHQNPALRTIPIVALIGKVNQTELSSLAELGVFYFLPKPLREPLIVKKMMAMVADLDNPETQINFEMKFRGMLARREIDAAIALTEQRMAANPKSARLHSAHALALYHAKRDDDALAEIQKVLAAIPNSTFALTLIGKIQLRKKNLVLAAKYLEMAHLICPFSIDRLLLMGEVLVASGKASVAEQRFRIASKLCPTSMAAKMGIAKCLVTQGDIEGAMEIAGKSEADKSGLISHLNQMGIGFSKAGRYGEAVSMYEYALRLATTNKQASSIWYNIALALSKDNRFDDAQTACTNALNVDSHNDKATRLMLTCREKLAAMPPQKHGKHSPDSAGSISFRKPVIMENSESKSNSLLILPDDFLERIESGIEADLSTTS